MKMLVLLLVLKIKKQNVQQMCHKLKFQDHKNCLEATQLENKINYPDKNKT